MIVVTLLASGASVLLSAGTRAPRESELRSLDKQTMCGGVVQNAQALVLRSNPSCVPDDGHLKEARLINFNVSCRSFLSMQEREIRLLDDYPSVPGLDVPGP